MYVAEGTGAVEEDETSRGFRFLGGDGETDVAAQGVSGEDDGLTDDLLDEVMELVAPEFSTIGERGVSRNGQSLRGRFRPKFNVVLQSFDGFAPMVGRGAEAVDEEKGGTAGLGRFPGPDVVNGVAAPGPMLSGETAALKGGGAGHGRGHEAG